MECLGSLNHKIMRKGLLELTFLHIGLHEIKSAAYNNSNAGICICHEARGVEPILQWAVLGDDMLGHPGQPQQDAIITIFIPHLEH